MEDITMTPEISQRQEEQEGQEELIEQEEQKELKGQEEQKGQSKESKWIPRYRLNEKIARIKELEEQINELQGVKEKADIYDALVNLISENPAYAKELNQLYQKHFGNKTSDSLFEENDRENDRIQRIEDELNMLKMENLRQEWNREMQEVNQDAKKRGISISEVDIYRLMDQEKIFSPRQAYNLLIGRRIDDLQKIWETNAQKNFASQKRQFPSFPSGSKLVGKPPSSFEEAFSLMKT